MQPHFKNNYSKSDFENSDEPIDWKKILTNDKGHINLPIYLDNDLKLKLFNLYFENSLFFKMVNQNRVHTNATSIQYIKNPTSVSRFKSEIGHGKLWQWQENNIILVEPQTPLVQTALISSYDLHYGAQQFVEAKIQKMMEYMLEEFETYAFIKVENSIRPDKTIEFYFDETRNISQLNDDNPLKEFRRLLIKTATKIRKTKDKKQGISFLKKSDIIIFVQDEIFDNLAEVGLLGNRVIETYAKCVTSITEIGGYEILPNPYLNYFDAIITTKFAAAGDVNIVAAQFDQTGTYGMGIYWEYEFAAAMLYDNVTYGFKIK